MKKKENNLRRICQENIEISQCKLLLESRKRSDIEKTRRLRQTEATQSRRKATQRILHTSMRDIPRRNMTLNTPQIMEYFFLANNERAADR